MLTWLNRPGSRRSDNTEITLDPFPARTAFGPVNKPTAWPCYFHTDWLYKVIL